MTPPRGSAQLLEQLTDVCPDQAREPSHFTVRAALQRVRVRVVDGPDRGLVQESTAPQLSIGTSPDNHIVLTDSTVSRYHLSVNREHGLMVRDLESRNGTFLGDLQIREAMVPVGARLRVGRTVIELLDGDQVGSDAPLLVPAIPGLVHAGPAMREITRAIGRIAQSNASVLVQGETGTGKELVARAIHQLSPRSKGPFVVVDSGALSPTLIASQLFGHERGAFTGAEGRREGAFEQAHRGTIFLDEIGDLPLSIQPALLGVLERRSFRRLGGKESIDVDVRVISATHRDLRADSGADAFRSDLYFRLAVAKLNLPPLRDRREDIEPLTEYFARQIRGVPGLPFSEKVLASLRAHPWPGNVRELRNVVENMLTVGSGPISLDQLAPLADAAADADTSAVAPYRVARSAAVAAFEQRYISDLIKKTGGNASGAARVARMDRPYLLSLLKKHGLR